MICGPENVLMTYLSSVLLLYLTAEFMSVASFQPSGSLCSHFDEFSQQCRKSYQRSLRDDRNVGTSNIIGLLDMQGFVFGVLQIGTR